MAKGPVYVAALLGHPPLAAEALDCLVVVCRHSVECRDAFPAQALVLVAKHLQQAASDAEGGVALAKKCCDAVHVLCLRVRDMLSTSSHMRGARPRSLR